MKLTVINKLNTMESIFIKKLTLVSKIFLPTITCFILVYSFQKLDFFKYSSFYYTILSFGILITIFNLKKIRYGIIINLISSISLSFLVFFLSLVIEGGLIYLYEELLIIFSLDFMKPIAIKQQENIISVAILSPILMFYSYKLLFQIKNNRYFKVTALISIIILLVLRLTNLMIEEIHLFIYWQTIMFLALQVILYEDELKILFRPNKKN
mgnify:CR=1 FL=1